MPQIKESLPFLNDNEKSVRLNRRDCSSRYKNEKFNNVSSEVVRMLSGRDDDKIMS